MVPLQKLEQIHQRYEFLEAQMSTGISGEEIAKLSKEYSQLKPVVEKIEAVSYTHLTLPTIYSV